MAGFTSSLQVEYIDGRSWRVTRELVYVTRRGDLVIVPAGFVTDFASIPRALWRIAPPTGDGDGDAWGPAAVMHDRLYSDQTISRSDADALFLEAMEECHVTKWKRVSFYYAVRLCGWVPYNNYQKNKVERK